MEGKMIMMPWAVLEMIYENWPLYKDAAKAFRERLLTRRPLTVAQAQAIEAALAQDGNDELRPRNAVYLMTAALVELRLERNPPSDEAFAEARCEVRYIVQRTWQPILHPFSSTLN